MSHSLNFDSLLAEDPQLAELLAGMTEQERAEFQKEMSGLFHEVQHMFETFEQRTIHPVLSEAILRETDDESLVLTVFDTLAVQAPEQLGEAEYLATLSPERRAVYALYILAGEVDNGGFNQYFYNTEAEAAAYLPEACALIGAQPYADLVARAHACYEQNRIAERHDGSLEHFCASYRDNPLLDYDEAFYALENEQPLNDLLVRFIRRHPQAFVG